MGINFESRKREKGIETKAEEYDEPCLAGGLRLITTTFGRDSGKG
jgi:hypothetical protein